MTDVHVAYDDTVDAAYISFVGQPRPGASAKMYACDPESVGGMINLDFDADGRLIGLEVLAASKKLPASVLAEAVAGENPNR